MLKSFLLQMHEFIERSNLYFSTHNKRGSQLKDAIASPLE